MLENIRLSFQGIWSHKMRSFLTMLGIIIGIASIISIVSTIKGTNEQIKQNLVGAGNNMVDVKLYKGAGEFYMDEGHNGSASSDKRAESRNQGTGSCETRYFLPVGRDNFTAYNGNISLNGGLRGVDQDYLAACGYILTEGRNFIERDYEQFQKVAILDTTAAASLFEGRIRFGQND